MTRKLRITVLAAAVLLLCLCCVCTAEEAVKKLTIVQPPMKTRYLEGEAFDPAGMIVDAILEDESVLHDVEYEYACSEITPNGSCMVTISYGEKSVNQVIFYTKLGNSEPYSVASTDLIPDSPLKGRAYVFLGSSVTYGASSEKESMVDFLMARDGAVCYKEAVSGTTLAVLKGADGKKSYVTRLNTFIEKNMCPVTPDAFICQLSTNDMHHPEVFGEITAEEVRDKDAFNTATTFGAMEYITALVKEIWGCPVVFYTNSFLDNPDYETMIAGLYRLQEKWGVTVIDLYNDAEFNQITEEERALYMADSIHPTKAGYRDWWLAKFEEALTQLLP